MPQPQPQYTWDGGASDNLPPPTYEEATGSMPRTHAPNTPSYHPSAPTAPYPSSYPYPTSSCMPSAPTADPISKPPYPSEIPYPITVLQPNTTPCPTTTPTSSPTSFTNTTPQHDPLLAPSRDRPCNERGPVVVVARQPSLREPGTGTCIRCALAVVAIVIISVVIYLISRLFLVPLRY